MKLWNPKKQAFVNSNGEQLKNKIFKTSEVTKSEMIADNRARKDRYLQETSTHLSEKDFH